MSEEWSEWFQHDGKGCPCVGQYVHVRFDVRSHVEGTRSMRLVSDGWEAVGIPQGGPSWHSDAAIECHIIRYRIRRPKGMAILEQLLAGIPAPVAPEVVE